MDFALCHSTSAAHKVQPHNRAREEGECVLSMCLCLCVLVFVNSCMCTHSSFLLSQKRPGLLILFLLLYLPRGRIDFALVHSAAHKVQPHHRAREEGENAPLGPETPACEVPRAGLAHFGRENARLRFGETRHREALYGCRWVGECVCVCMCTCVCVCVCVCCV